jgi:pyruvate dehydrogenase E1 component
MIPETLDDRPEPRVDDDQMATLCEIEQRVLWLATSIVDHANRLRANPSGIKVGGHQASSASMVSIMTALWFTELRAEDRVSTKPHASPVLHALEHVIGVLDESWLPTLRAFGGLQSYPSRTKDPIPADYSTGSVGIGATAPIWGAIARRYVEGHFGGVGTGRQYSLVGDAELDEGACWEAILDPMVADLGEVVWIVDFNRQSLDRVVPTLGAARIEGMFAAAGWQVITVKYGTELEALFTTPGGEALRQRIDGMTNAEYHRLLRHDARELRRKLPGGGPTAATIEEVLAPLEDEELSRLFRNLGGHDLKALLTAFGEIDDSRPTVILAYTLKGYGLPTEGHPQNHSALLTGQQIAELAARVGVRVDEPWAPFPPNSEAAKLCAEVGERLRRPASSSALLPEIPTDLGRTPTGTATTQAALGRALVNLARTAPTVAERLVTVSPDVTSSTNLAGWVNKVGVWSVNEKADWFADDAQTNLHWREAPQGQHIELGIAEINLVSLLGELGTVWSRWGQPLLPIGVLYDPFVGRALEPWSFGMYAGGQSILVGTPSGVTLAAEGGAHQSIITPSIGLEQPLCTSYEPAFVLDTEWCLLASLGQLGRSGGRSAYLRLSTRPVDQTLANIPSDAAAREYRRKQVVAGAYALHRSPEPQVTLVGVGAMMSEVLEAAARIEDMGICTDVVCVTSPGLVFEALRARRGTGDGPSWIVDTVFPAARRTPIVTVHDGHPHTLGFMAGIYQLPCTNLGVTSFGQSGDLASTYRHHGIDVDSIVEASVGLTGY